MSSKIDYSLYLVTDRELMRARSVEECVEQAVLGGCTVVQLREKKVSASEFYETALKLRKVTAHFGVPLIINDRADIAKAIDADGVHIGQGDLPYSAARGIVGNDKTVGVSVSCLAEALEAARLGADYLGVGAMFATGTKTDADFTSMEELLKIRKSVSLPIVVIGGINKETVPLFFGTGINGVAVVSAVVAHRDIAHAAKEIMAMIGAGAKFIARNPSPVEGALGLGPR